MKKGRKAALLKVLEAAKDLSYGGRGYADTPAGLLCPFCRRVSPHEAGSIYHNKGCTRVRLFSAVYDALEVLK